jgi:D-alanyl-D-alanine carboxypeptidase (penicillin-binding protein 5/6)
MAELAREAMSHREFADIVDKKEAKIKTNTREIQVYNTNHLLSTYPPANGVKTGTSSQGGPSLVASAEQGGESYVSVVLDAMGADDTPGDRFADSRSILDYGFANYEHQTLVSRGKTYGEADVPFRRGETVGLAAAENVAVAVAPGDKVGRRVTTDEPPPAARAGQKLGEVEALVDGRSVGRSPLVATRGYEEASFLQKIWYRVQGLFG